MPDKLTILAELSVATAAFDAARRSLADEVARARQAGASWSEIGQALGMTRQGAFQRFGAVRQRHDEPEFDGGRARPPSEPVVTAKRSANVKTGGTERSADGGEPGRVREEGDGGKHQQRDLL